MAIKVYKVFYITVRMGGCDIKLVNFMYTQTLIGPIGTLMTSLMVTKSKS